MNYKQTVTFDGPINVTTPSVGDNSTQPVNSSWIIQKAYANLTDDQVWGGAQTFNGVSTFNGVNVFEGDTTFNGGITFAGTLLASNLSIDSNDVTVNDGEAGDGVDNGVGAGGLVVDRGTLDDATWRFNETTSEWECKVGSGYGNAAFGLSTADDVYLRNNIPTHPNHAVSKHYIDNVFVVGQSAVIPVVANMLLDSYSINFTFDPVAETEIAEVVFDPDQMEVTDQLGLRLKDSYVSTLTDTAAVEADVVDIKADLVNMKDNSAKSWPLAIAEDGETHRIVGIQRGYYDLWDTSETYSIGNEVTFQGAGFQYADGLHRPRKGVNDGNGFLFISHIGEIQPSGFLPITAGNVREDDIVEIYRTHQIFQDLRDPSKLKGRCGRCEYRDLCGGQRGRAYGLTGDYLAEDPACIYIPEASPAQLEN